jgi:STE24 endopeptidase
VPAAFAGTVTLEAHRKAADYTLAKGRFGLLTTAAGQRRAAGLDAAGRPGRAERLLRDALQPAGATSPTSWRCWRPLRSSAR